MEKNGLVQIKYEGEKVAKGDSVFRYYSNNEDDLINKISDLDEQINKALEENESIVVSSDMLSLERQIENTLNVMYNTNEIRKLDEYLKKIESYVTKKAEIAGERSPSGSLVKNLIQKRTNLEAELNTSSKIINAPISGIVSYRVDGLEEILKIDDFSNLNKKTLDGYNLKTGSVIPQTSKKGKVVNNFVCYIAAPINTEKADSAKIGDKVARQIILDLKGKLSGNQMSLLDSSNNDELTDALVALGYKQADIKKIVKNVNPDLTIENQIKEALKLLLK